MSRASRPVLLIGGIPGDTTEDVLRTLGPALGDLAVALPDGETGIRRMWVGAVAMRVWDRCVELEKVREPRGAPGLPAGMPAGYDDFWIYRSRPGVERLHVGTLHYPDDAIAAYRVFAALREQGVIPAGVRFQFGLPFPEDACREFTDNAADMALIVTAYLEALEHDIDAICANIPHADLLFQWEINWETIAVDHGDYLEGQAPLDYRPHGVAFTRYTDYLRRLSPRIPGAVALGMHLCYGDLHHRHFLEPRDLGACVRMANAAVGAAGRRIDYVHMPVPRERGDDAYFAPLADLHIGTTTLYAGLVHYTDGVPGSLARLRCLHRHYDGPTGVATECGLGRRPRDQSLERLLGMHREVAAAL
ncbi:MAG: hypothetical protein IT495_13520 [Gammaproteobacteria bacterium]|nr:hypothetical protein [Gammaproteobacteria bacterium]